jgi:hypothetical protein
MIEGSFERILFVGRVDAPSVCHRRTEVPSVIGRQFISTGATELRARLCGGPVSFTAVDRYYNRCDDYAPERYANRVPSEEQA